ncbi:YihY/virulence factor BrkB family protein [Porticoccaceae bacterium]|nr:YihY/virulence factor BrkB family protein [Porticoccaceae bacterium]
MPAFQELGGQVEEFIFSKFLPSSGQEITQYLSEFSNQARKLSVAGVAIILVTALLILSNIEKTFNHIWATTAGRKGLAGFYSALCGGAQLQSESSLCAVWWPDHHATI